MGNEFKVLKDIATISATISELAAVNRMIRTEIDSPDFLQEYDSLIEDILNTYQCVENILQPLIDLRAPTSFKENFISLFQWYSESYQPALSEPRINAELTFQKYLQFCKRRETKTGYPPLKKAFSRLHEFVDKWIDNDIWLAMTIDGLLKVLYRLLGEVIELNTRDSDAAFNYYTSFVAGLSAYLTIIRQMRDQIEDTQPQRVAMPPLSMTR